VIKQKVDIEKTVSNVDCTDASKEEKAPKIKLKPFLKAGIAAAAVILIGLALFHNTTSAKADIRVKISNAIKDLKGVYISTYSADRTKLIQERWISDSLKIYMTKIGNEFVLSDINTGLMKNKNYDSGESNAVQLNEDAKADIQQRINRSLGLMPVYDISVLPRDYEWLPVDDHPKEAEGFEIYDLKWADQKNQLRKWRFFIDSTTFLPKKIEVSGIEIGQGENLEMVMLAESISDTQIRKVIQDAGF
jgi:hypothetical protein